MRFIHVGTRATLSIPCDRGEKTFTTSCVNTAATLALCFFGKNKAKSIMQKINEETLTCMSIQLSSTSDKKFIYKINNLIDNKLIRKTIDSNLNKDDIALPEKLLLQEDYAKLYFDYLQPFLDGAITDNIDQSTANLKKKLGELNYPFNLPVINDLEKEIFANKELIKPNLSIIYLIVIQKTIPKDVSFDGSSFSTEYEHAFHIEQFFCPFKKEVRYRIYQSWICQANLAEDLIKRKYDWKGNYSMNESEMTQFLNYLRELYCSYGDHDRKPIYNKCFGHIALSSKLLHFKESAQTLCGVSLRWVAQKINPYDCLQHIEEVENSSAALRLISSM